MEDNMNKRLAQNKVLMLYVLKKAKHDITESDLFKLISPVNNINYFYFKQLLADLVDSKLVQTYTKDEDTSDHQILYRLTADGQNSLSLTIDVLPVPGIPYNIMSPDLSERMISFILSYGTSSL